MAKEPKKEAFSENDVIAALKKAGATADCPRCGHTTFRLLKGFFVHSIQNSTTGLQLGGPSLPTWVMVCMRCGFLSQHDMHVLMGIEQVEPLMH